MKEMRYGGNIFLLPRGAEAAVVTTNGIVKSDGRAVMGAGIAKYARDNLDGIDALLGGLLRTSGNHSYFMGSFQDHNRPANGIAPSVFAITMPTKNDWRDPSDLDLIRRSARELVLIAERNNLEKIYMPPPGCSNGRLDYIAQVRPALAPILGEKFYICLHPDIYDKLHPEN